MTRSEERGWPLATWCEVPQGDPLLVAGNPAAPDNHGSKTIEQVLPIFDYHHYMIIILWIIAIEQVLPIFNRLLPDSNHPDDLESGLWKVFKCYRRRKKARGNHQNRRDQEIVHLVATIRNKVLGAVGWSPAALWLFLWSKMCSSNISKAARLLVISRPPEAISRGLKTMLASQYFPAVPFKNMYIVQRDRHLARKCLEGAIEHMHPIPTNI